MKTLLRSLANTFFVGIQEDYQGQPGARALFAPHVYTRAIHSDGDLVASLSGIRELTRELGFSGYQETIYSTGGASATFHADHQICSVSLAVDCNTEDKTVSLAVSGFNGDETWEQFQKLTKTLFGDF